MKTALTIVGVVLLVAIVFFLYILIVGANESRRRNLNSKDKNKEN